MRFPEALDILGKEKATQLVRAYVDLHNLNWRREIEPIWEACWKYPELRPDKGSIKDTPEKALLRWLESWRHGYNNRASKMNSTPSKTKSDPVMLDLMASRIPSMTKELLEEIQLAHRLSMAAENVMGSILEEYLAIELAPHGWASAWGQTLKHVDFVGKRASLLQIKNRSNGENSSSSKVRKGTTIKKWARLNANSGATAWPLLRQMTGCEALSEEKFAAFAKKIIDKNPGIIAMPTTASNEANMVEPPSTPKEKISYRRPSASFGG